MIGSKLCVALQSNKSKTKGLHIVLHCDKPLKRNMFPHDLQWTPLSLCLPRCLFRFCCPSVFVSAKLGKPISVLHSFMKHISHYTLMAPLNRFSASLSLSHKHLNSQWDSLKKKTKKQWIQILDYHLSIWTFHLCQISKSTLILMPSVEFTLLSGPSVTL